MKTFILEHRKMIGALFLVAVLVLAGYYFRVKKLNDLSDADQVPNEGAPLNEAVNTAVSGASGAEISVSDQALGSRITVGKLLLPKRMWVAIHADDGGKPGKVLGAARYQAGAWEKKEIELVKPATSGLYYAVLHSDDGNDVYESKSDLPLLVNGNPVLSRFVVGDGGEI